jgi:hypothetical protein
VAPPVSGVRSAGGAGLGSGAGGVVGSGAAGVGVAGGNAGMRLKINRAMLAAAKRPTNVDWTCSSCAT